MTQQGPILRTWTPSGSQLSPRTQLLRTRCCTGQPIPAGLQWAEPTRCLCKNSIQTRVVLPSGQNPEQGLLPRSPCSQEQKATARASQDLQVVYFPTVAGSGDECHVKYIRGHYHPRERRALCQESCKNDRGGKHSEVAMQPSVGNLSCRPNVYGTMQAPETVVEGTQSRSQHTAGQRPFCPRTQVLTQKVHDLCALGRP